MPNKTPAPQHQITPTKPPLPVKMLLTLLLSIALGYFLLVASYLLPTKSITSHVKASVPTLQAEGQYPFLIDKNWTTVLDNYTDSLMLSKAAYRSGHPFRDALRNEHTLYGDFDPLENLIQFANQQDESSGSPSPYARYWHGYLILLKPLLELFTLPQLRVLNTILQIALTIIMFLSLYKKLGLFHFLAFLGVITVINPLITGCSLQYSSIFYITMIASLIILHRAEKIRSKHQDILLFFMIGIAAAYFDLLTYPIASLGVPLLILLASIHTDSTNSHKLSSWLMPMLTDTIAWGLGYAAMWASKWALATAFTDLDVLSDAMNQAVFRLDGQITELRMTNMAAVAISINLELLLKTLVLPALGLFLIVIILSICIHRYMWKPNITRIVTELLIAFYPIIWDGILKNHSLIHRWMTFRGMAVLTFAIFLIFAGSLQKNDKLLKSDKRVYLKRNVSFFL